MTAINGQTDVAFAIDSSSNHDVVQAMKLFIKEMIKPMPVESKDARISLIDYNVGVVQKVSFPNSSISAMSLALDTVKSKLVSSDASGAIEFVKKNVLSSSVTRPNARKILVILTNGEKEIPNVRLIGKTFEELNESDVDYVIVNVGGRGDNIKDLREIAERHGRIVSLERPVDVPMATPVILQLVAIQKGLKFRIYKFFFPPRSNNHSCDI